MRLKHLLARPIAGAFLLAGHCMAQVDPAMNPFFQPNETTIYYGSGDVNADGQINVDDYTTMQSGVQNDMADIDGNGTPSTANDLSILNQYLQGSRDYLPGHWNYLQTVAERESWLEAMLAIDPTDEIPYQTGVFISGDYRSVTELNFAGRIDPADPNIPYSDSIITFGKFNMPIYGVVVGSQSTNWAHGMNAILIGENPLNFEDWCPVEPQLDDINVQPGSPSIPHNMLFMISALAGFHENGNRINISLVAFQIDENGLPSLYPVEGVSPNPDLITTRPSVAIRIDAHSLPSQYHLFQNFPNPFNPSTKIHYDIPAESMVAITVYDVQGRQIKTLVNEEKPAGSYAVRWDGSDHSGVQVGTGVYLARLTGDHYSSVVKMVYLR